MLLLDYSCLSYCFSPQQHVTSKLKPTEVDEAKPLLSNTLRVLCVCVSINSQDKSEPVTSALSPSATPQGYCLPRTRFPLTSMMVLLPTTASGKRSCKVGDTRTQVLEQLTHTQDINTPFHKATHSYSHTARHPPRR